MTLVRIYGELRESYRSSRKREMDRQHWFYQIYRPLSFPLTALCIWFGASANFVTLLSLTALLAAIALFAIGYLLAGALVYCVAYLLDFVDGNIARYHGQSSYFGKFVDGLVDSLTFGLYIAIALGNTGAGRSLLGADIELPLGIGTAFGFLFNAYFQTRLMYLLCESGQLHIAPTTTIAENGPRKTGAQLLHLAKWGHRAITSSMPIALLVAVIVDGLSMFLVVFFVIHVVLGLLEISYSLARLHRRLAIARPY
jgi:phosphatidylglycerophosphate synthase